MLAAAQSDVHLHAALVKAKIRIYVESNRDAISELNKQVLFRRLFVSYMHKCGAMAQGQAFIICAELSSDEHDQILFSEEISRQLRD